MNLLNIVIVATLAQCVALQATTNRIVEKVVTITEDPVQVWTRICRPLPDYIGQAHVDKTLDPSTTVSSLTEEDASDTLTVDLKNCSRHGVELQEMRTTVRDLNESLNALRRDLKVMQSNDNEDGCMARRCAGDVRKKNRGSNKSTSVCPDMFTQFWVGNISTCLWFSTTTGSWADAYVYCQVMHSELAIINTATLHSNVTIYLKENNMGGRYFIGGSDIQREGHWQWIRPKKHFSKRMWMKGHPENKKKKKENCLVISKPKYKFVDMRCDKRFRFVCEKKPHVAM